MTGLKQALIMTAARAMPRPGDAALNARQHTLLAEVRDALGAAQGAADPLIQAEDLRLARAALDRLIGRATTEDMLDALFGRFCIGK
jgi:tRNA modification GTPase